MWMLDFDIYIFIYIYITGHVREDIANATPRNNKKDKTGENHV